MLKTVGSKSRFAGPGMPSNFPPCEARAKLALESTSAGFTRLNSMLSDFQISVFPF